jgi:hypothetical protein
MFYAMADSIPDSIRFAQQPGRGDEQKTSQYQQGSYRDKPTHKVTSKCHRFSGLHEIIIPQSAQIHRL